MGVSSVPDPDKPVLPDLRLLARRRLDDDYISILTVTRRSDPRRADRSRRMLTRSGLSVRLAAQFFVTFFRGTPLLAQLYLVYYGAGEIHDAARALSPVVAVQGSAALAWRRGFIMNTGAYQAYVIHGALLRIAEGTDRCRRGARHGLRVRHAQGAACRKRC